MKLVLSVFHTLSVQHVLKVITENMTHIQTVVSALGVIKFLILEVKFAQNAICFLTNALKAVLIVQKLMKIYKFVFHTNFHLFLIVF